MSNLIYFLYTLVCPWPLLSIAYAFSIYVMSPRRFMRLIIPARVCRDPPDFPNWKYVPPALFSVSYYDAIVESSSMVLSTVCIPIQRIHPTIQHQLKDVQRTTPRRRPINWRRFLWYPILLFTFISAPRTYAIPGTNHVIASGESSLDQVRQHAYVNTIVDTAVSNSPNMDNIIAITVDGVTPPEPNVGL
jgi:hypothetical protein